jgi:superfamily II DNA or RNA helicase
MGTELATTTKDAIQGEALEAVIPKMKAGVSMSMGTGKTFLGLKHMAHFYHDTARYLVVAPRKKIFKSWNEDAIKFNHEMMLEHIEFSTYLSLPKMDLDFDIVYLDECHSLKESHKEWLLEFERRGGRILGLTGTYPIYKNTEKGKMCNYFCPKVFEYTTDEAVEAQILNDYKIFVHQLYLDGTNTMEVKKKDGGSFMTSEVKTYDYWNTRIMSANTGQARQIAQVQRMKAMQSFPSKERYAAKLLTKVTKKTLLFATSQDQADRLCKHTVHSKNKDSDRNLQLFKDGEIMILGSVEQISEGQNIPQLENGIIVHAYGNNKKAAQKIGRFLRLNPDQVASVHILCYVNSVDKDWVTNALKAFDSAKIQWIHPIQ